MSKIQHSPKSATPTHAAARDYGVSVLTAADGKRLAKLYRDLDAAPSDYDAGMFFHVEEFPFDSFDDLVAGLADADPNQCIIRGAVREDARGLTEAGPVRRLAYARDGYPAVFEPRARSWIMLDADQTDTPFDASDVEGSVHAWHTTLPDEIRCARSAFFLSASAHRSPTVRGKLLVELAAPLDSDAAEAYAKAHGFDGSVCRTVQPNYVAAPIFDGCTDPLASWRAPMHFDGAPARLPALSAKAKRATLAAVEAAPAVDDLPEPSERARDIAAAIGERWLQGGRVESNAWLHLCGWLLGRGWSKAELGAMLQLLDAAEPDGSKRAEHWHILGNARAIDGPGGAREWLDVDFARVDRAIGGGVDLSKFISPPGDVAEDYLGQIVDLATPVQSLRYLCEGMSIAFGGKCTAVHGYAGSGKGPFLSLLALCIASGKPFLGCPVMRVPVVYLDAETGELAEIRLKRLARTLGVDLAELQRDGWILFRHVDRDLTTLLPSIGEAARSADKGSGVMIGLDSYSSLVAGDENKSEYADPLWDLGRLGKRCNAVPIVTMHQRKGDRAASAKASNPLEDISGTNRLAGAIATSIRLTPDEADDKVITVTCTRAPERRFDAMKLTWADGKDGGLIAAVEGTHIPSRGELREAAQIRKDVKKAKAVEDRANKIEQALAKCNGVPMPASKIRGMSQISGSNWTDAFDVCLKRGTVRIDHNGKLLYVRPEAASVGRFKRDAVPLKLVRRDPVPVDGLAKDFVALTEED